MKKSKKLLVAFVGIILGLALSGCHNPFLQLGKEAVAQSSSPIMLSPSPGDAFQDGSEEYPFLVYDVITLKRVGSDEVVNGHQWALDKHYLQIKDIDLTGTGNWVPIDFYKGGGFFGVYDGGGKIISGLYCNYPDFPYDNEIGLFFRVRGTVKNLGVVDAVFEAINGYALGGIAAYNNGGLIKNCFFKGEITGGSTLGGIVGYNAGVVEECYSAGSLNGLSWCGGVVGYNREDGTVKNSYSLGTCVANACDAGGVAGTNYGEIQNCYAKGEEVTGSMYTGGIAGINFRDAILENCVALYESIENTTHTVLNGRIMGDKWIPSVANNNYAYSGMLIDGSTVTGSLDDKNGEGILSTDYESKTWWTTSATWSSPWDFVNVWEWDAVKKLPVLRNVGGQ